MSIDKKISKQMLIPSNDGSGLEALSAMIESALLPSDFIVELNKKPRDEDGDQIAELDVVITGKTGSAPFKMLIECRDRPSAGAAPVSWIEQLVARRSRLGFNTVIAVSSTGFTPVAQKFADTQNIILRSVNEMTAEEFISHIPYYSPITVNAHRCWRRSESAARGGAKVQRGWEIRSPAA